SAVLALLASPDPLLLASPPAFSDAGMWTFHDFPRELVKGRYGADLSPAWLERVRTATARLSNCTATFVSPDGLMLTNHHRAARRDPRDRYRRTRRRPAQAPAPALVPGQVGAAPLLQRRQSRGDAGVPANRARGAADRRSAIRLRATGHDGSPAQRRGGRDA